MKNLKGRVIFLLLSACTTHAAAQLLTSSPSVDAIGMGGVAASLPSDNAMAPMANPAQVGLFSLNGILSVGTYVSPTSYSNWWGNQSVATSSAVAGMDLTGYMNTPFRVSIGLGYSRTGENSTGYPYFKSYDQANDVSFGIGFNYFVNVGLGFGLNWISSSYQNQPLQNQESNATTYSYGGIVQIPVAEILQGEKKEGAIDNPTVQSIANLAVAYNVRDMGSIPDNSTLFSRQGDLGINFEIGVESSFNGQPWKLLSVTLAREADESLTRADSVFYTLNRGDSVYNYFEAYTSAIRHMSPFNNLIVGTYGTNVGVRSGLQIQAAEFLYLRFGKGAGSFVGNYTTFGFGIRLRGLMRLLCLVSNDSNPKGFLMSLLTDHVDLQFDYSKMTSWNGAPAFNELNMVVKP
ncbi:MAG: hypothetical protein M1378_07080 [Bacteroidetes bacterium]|jgi:hypothetical protein|nr:hypothetical protein [Bacteroidota bacterium]MCL5034404.1 hypothetical protein [Bacteroidota bacterium]